MPNQEEQLLIGRIKEGNGDSWEQLITRYENRLYYYAAKRVNNQETCEDLVQETFLAFLSNIKTFNPDKKIQNYLFGIIKNKVVDFIRRKKAVTINSAPADSSGNPNDSVFIDSAQGASTWYRGEEKKTLENEALLNGLSLLINHYISKNEYNKLMAIELIFVLGLSNLETAGKLGIKNTEVASIFHWAKNFIHDYLQNSGLSSDIFPQFYEKDLLL